MVDQKCRDALDERRRAELGQARTAMLLLCCTSWPCVGLARRTTHELDTPPGARAAYATPPPYQTEGDCAHYRFLAATESVTEVEEREMESKEYTCLNGSDLTGSPKHDTG
jgi:hypothetical protein